MQLFHFHHCKRHLKKRTIALDPSPQRTLCTLVKMMTIMDDPYVNLWRFARFTYFISSRPPELQSITMAALSASIQSHAICVFPHQLAARQQAFYVHRVYTMHSIQPAEHLNSLIKTKNRCLLRNRGLKTECRNHVVHHAGVYSRYEILLVVTRRQHGRY